MKEQRKTIDIIISVVVAIALWAFVINVVNPPTTEPVKDIPVQLLHQEALTASNLAISGDGNYTVDVVLTGSRADLSGITANDILATADISGLGVGQNYVNVSVSAPDNLEITEIHSQKIQVYVEELIEAEKPVKVAFSDLDGEYEVTVISQDNESITVSGAKSLVERVDCVRVDLDTSILETDQLAKQKLEGIALDADGNIISAVKLSREEIGVTATKYATKDVKLAVSVNGTPGLNAQVGSVNIPSTIKVKGSANALERVTSISGGTIDISGITADSTYTIKPELPSGIQLSDTQGPVKATVKLADMASVTYTYTLDDLVFLNLSDGLAARVIGVQNEDGEMAAVETITVTANGSLSVIKALTPASLLPALDLSYIAAGELKLEVGCVYSAGDLSITVDPAIFDVEVTQVAVTEGAETPQE